MFVLFDWCLVYLFVCFFSLQPSFILMRTQSLKLREKKVSCEDIGETPSVAQINRES